MVKAPCPFCTVVNVVGPAQKKRPGDSITMTQTCEHYVFRSLTNSPAAEYVHVTLYVEVGTISGGHSLEHEILILLSGYFRFVGPVAFAPSEKARDDARRAVEDFLKARKILA